MAGFGELIAAQGCSAWRNLVRFGALTHNNLFAVIVLLMAEEPVDRPSSTAVFYLVIGILSALPSASVTGTGTPRGLCARLVTRFQSTCS